VELIITQVEERVLCAVVLEDMAAVELQLQAQMVQLAQLILVAEVAVLLVVQGLLKEVGLVAQESLS
jgi:hypothetical protein